MFPRNLPIPPHIIPRLNHCQGWCDPGWVWYAIPGNPLTMNWACRCLKCLTYWEVTPAGEVRNIQRPVREMVALAAVLDQVQATLLEHSSLLKKTAEGFERLSQPVEKAAMLEERVKALEDRQQPINAKDGG